MIINKIIIALKEHGVINLFIYKLNAILKKLSGNNIKLIKYYFFAQPVSDKTIVKNPEKRKIKISMPNKNHAILKETPRTFNVIMERFNQDSKCFVATKDNNFIGFIWFTENAYNEDEVRCKFIPTPTDLSVWDFDIYIKPDNRLSLAFPMLWDRTNQYLSNKGYQWTMSRITAVNSRSLSVHKKLGAVYCGHAVFLCLWQFQIMVSSLSPFFNLSMKSQPQIKIPPPNAS